MAAPLPSVELAPRSDGARYRRATLAIDEGGALTLHTLDLGASAAAAWGQEAEELTLTVPAAQLGRLALALAAELLAGGEGAADRLADLCERRGVAVRIADWS